MKFEIDGWTLITGANGGIGSAVTEHLLKHGVSRLLLHFRSESGRLQEIVEKYPHFEGEMYEADLTEEDQVKRMFSSMKEANRVPLNVVNIAGGSTNGMFWKLSLEDFQKVVGMNLQTTFLVSREAVSEMRNSQYGRLINVSSVVARKGVVGASHYCAAKAGIEGMTRALSKEVGSKNITVNSLALGYFEAGLIRDVPEKYQDQLRAEIPLKRFGNGAEVGHLVGSLLDKSASYITGQVIPLNGGLD